MNKGNNRNTPETVNLPGHASKADECEKWISRLEVPTGEELEKISALRKLDPQALKIAADRGNLKMACAWGQRAFVVTDLSHRNAKARRLDGEAWNGGAKSRNLPGAENTLPIGLPESKGFPAIALVERETDFLAAFHCLYVLGGHERISPVCMGGAACDIPEHCRPAWEGKRIRIFPAVDEPSRKASVRWATILQSWGCTVDWFNFEGYTTPDGSPVKDLNDWCDLSIDSYHTNKSDIGKAFFF